MVVKLSRVGFFVGIYLIFFWRCGLLYMHGRIIITFKRGNSDKTHTNKTLYEGTAHKKDDRHYISLQKYIYYNQMLWKTYEVQGNFNKTIMTQYWYYNIWLTHLTVPVYLYPLILILEYREAFNLFDKDGDGSISSKELAAMMLSMGQQPTDAEVRRFIEQVDCNGRIQYFNDIGV